jgi:hypothetical protein
VAETFECVPGWLQDQSPEVQEWVISQSTPEVLVVCGEVLKDTEFATADLDQVLLRAWYLVKQPMYEEIDREMSRSLASGRVERVELLNDPEHVSSGVRP